MENIAILMGGSSKEKEISLKSAHTIYTHIDKNKYNPYKVLCVNDHEFKVILDNKIITIDNANFSFKLNNTKIQFHKAYMMIHGDPGENGKLCAYLEKIKIPYTSCNTIASELTFNKFKCNTYLNSLGYKVPQSNMISDNNNYDFPCIIKPACSGSSFGISKVYNDDELQQAINEAKKYDQSVIIEEFIAGREVTCAVFKFHDQVKTLPITEIISENDIFDYDAKYNGKSREETPADIDKKIQKNVKKISKNIYEELELSGIVRIDFIIQNESPYVIEINTIPGFSEESIVPQMLKCANIELEQFITLELNRINI